MPHATKENVHFFADIHFVSLFFGVQGVHCPDTPVDLDYYKHRQVLRVSCNPRYEDVGSLFNTECLCLLHVHFFHLLFIVLLCYYLALLVTLLFFWFFVL